MARKRMLAGAVLAVAVLVGAAPAGATQRERNGGGPEVTTEPVSFTIAPGTCDQVPPETSFEATGERRTVAFERTDDRGVIHQRTVDHAEGTATDQDVNVYDWTYDNRVRASNTLDDPSVYRGWMVDEFTMTGGPASYETSFAGFLIDNHADLFEIHPTRIEGDPFTFPSGPGRCDPI